MESQALKYYRGNEGNGKENKYHLILRHIRKQEYLSVPKGKAPKLSSSPKRGHRDDDVNDAD